MPNASELMNIALLPRLGGVTKISDEGPLLRDIEVGQRAYGSQIEAFCKAHKPDPGLPGVICDAPRSAVAPQQTLGELAVVVPEAIEAGCQELLQLCCCLLHYLVHPAETCLT